MIEIDDLAGAVAFESLKWLRKHLAPDFVFPWLSAAMSGVGTTPFNREWVVLHMFVLSEAFAKTFEGTQRGEQLITLINNKLCEAFAELGVFEMEGMHGQVAKRYTEYFDAVKLLGSLGMGCSAAFLSMVGHESGTAHEVLSRYVDADYSIQLSLAEGIRHAV